MWTQHFIYYATQNNLMTGYAQMADGTTLAAHLREAGSHYKKSKGRDFNTFSGGWAEV